MPFITFFKLDEIPTLPEPSGKHELHNSFEDTFDLTLVT